MKIANGSRVTYGELISGSQVDANERPVLFEIDEDHPATLIGTGEDGQKYSADFTNSFARLVVGEPTNMKELRRRGAPVPKDKVKELDEEIKKEDLKSKAAAKAAAKGISQEEAEKEVVKEEREREEKATERGTVGPQLKQQEAPRRGGGR